MRSLIFLFLIFSCQSKEASKPFRSLSDSSCLAASGTEDSPFKNAYCYLPDGTSLLAGEGNCVIGGYLDEAKKGGSTLPSGSLGECQSSVSSRGEYSHCAVISLPGKPITRWSEARFTDHVVIPQDQVVLLDTNATVKSLDVRGILVFDHRDLTLTTGKLFLSGALKIGLENAPFRNEATIVIKEGLILQGGALQIFGKRSANGGFVWGIPAYDNIHLKKE
ncbi:MAG: G8 domain-containing protein [Bacteriovoracaceae bacterium]